MSHQETTLTNIYPLGFPDGSQLDYDVWHISPQPQTPKLHQQITTWLWREKLHLPATALYVDGKRCVATAASDRREPIEYKGDGALAYQLTPEPTSRHIDLKTVPVAQHELVELLLGRMYREHLRRDRRLVQGYQFGEFYLRQPDQPYQDPDPKKKKRRQKKKQPIDPMVDIFRGVHFRVQHVDDVGFCLVIDVHTSYVGKRPMAAYRVADQWPNMLDTWHGFERWINDYGRIKQGVYWLHEADESIGELRLTESTVYQFLLTKYPWLAGDIQPGDPAGFVIYRTDDVRDETKHYPVAQTLLKPKFSLASREVKALNDSPAFKAHERQKRINNIRKHFFNAKISAKRVFVESAHSITRQRFPLPTLCFGGNTIVEPPEEDTARTRRDWAYTKLDTLETHGPAETTRIYNPYVIYPDHLEHDLFIDEIIETTRRHAETYGHIKLTLQSQAYESDQHPRAIAEEALSVIEYENADAILLALPQGTDRSDQVYNIVKSKSSVPVKCFSTDTLLSQRQHLSNYMRLNTLAMLVEFGTRPWGLASNLHHDLQLGASIAFQRQGSLVGFSTSLGQNGLDLSFQHYRLPSKIDHVRREAIPGALVERHVVQQLERFYKQYDRLPYHLLWQREGRTYEDEIEGIQRGIEQVIAKHENTNRPNWTVVNILKSSAAPIRLFSEHVGAEQLRSPLSGTYFIQQDHKGYLITAGDPFITQGTPNPLGVEVVYQSVPGTTRIETVLQDIFWQTQLNWNAPTREMRLQMLLRFNQHHLEREALESHIEALASIWEN